MATGRWWRGLVAAVPLVVPACDRQVLRLLPETDGGVASGGTGGRRSSNDPCTHDGQCDGARPRCDTTVGRCVECTSADDCESYETCDRASKRCVVPCSRDEDCWFGSNRSDRCDVGR